MILRLYDADGGGGGGMVRLFFGAWVGVEERVCSVHVQIAAAREKENGGNWGADITNQIFEGVKIVIITDDR